MAPKMPPMVLAHMGVYVRDLQAMVEFYTGVIGLTVTDRGRMKDFEIAFLSQDTTLLPGTLILTGTPAGVGYTRGVYLKSGDVVRVEVDKLGVLRNTVAEG